MSEFIMPHVETYWTMIEHNPELPALMDGARSYWAGKTWKDVCEEMPKPTMVRIDDMRDVQLIELKPDENDDDYFSRGANRTTVLALPYLNGWTPQHYIRAKTLQLMTHPNSSLIVLPNNGGKEPAYSFTDSEKKRLDTGDIRPLGEIQMKALEAYNDVHTLGTLSLTGYSQGALAVMAIATIGSVEIEIDRVNADETPSKIGRSAKQLSKDFRTSSPLGGLRGAIKDADINGLSKAMNGPRLTRDLARFGLASIREEGRLLNKAMTGSADYLVEATLNNGLYLKLGSIVGSQLFDYTSIQTESNLLEIVDYVGAPFDRKHGTGDNVYAHALMAAQTI